MPADNRTLQVHEGGNVARATTTVLVVEDDAIVRAWVRLALKGSEFSVGGEAPTTAAALDLVDRRRGDLLLVDHRLPTTSARSSCGSCAGRATARPR